MPEPLCCKGCKDCTRQGYGRPERWTVTNKVRMPEVEGEDMANATKRIPITEERWKELNEEKEAGQTYDELLEELLQYKNRRQLADRAQAVREVDSEELTSLDEL